jgi:hypothetical protein
LTVLEILLRTQDREIEARHLDPQHLMSTNRSTFRISVGKCMAETVTARIGPWMMVSRGIAR